MSWPKGKPNPKSAQVRAKMRRPSPRKGKTLIELFGEERAAELKEANRASHLGKPNPYLIGHFGSSHYPSFHGWEQYPTFKESSVFNPYGVCDDFGQILVQCPEILEEGRHFLITLTPITKKTQDAVGGWRWHKWGPYIGRFTPTTEYLYDEPEIEQVLVYHIYERKD